MNEHAIDVADPSSSHEWEWTQPIPSDAGDVTVKLRKRLIGYHEDTPVVGPDPSLTAQDVRGKRDGVSPMQVRYPFLFRVDLLHFTFFIQLTADMLYSRPTGSARRHDVYDAYATSITDATI